MDFEKNYSAGYLANHLSRLFAKGLQKRIKPLGLGVGQFPALLMLWEEDGQTQKDLVRALNIEQATIANTLVRMERDGLILRRTSEEDGRVQKIFLTAKARALKEEAVEAALSQNAVALEEFSEEEMVLFIRLMHKAIGSMQQDDERIV